MTLNLLALLLTAPVSVPVSVAPPTPVAFTQVVTQQATLNGQVYTVSGTLTFTPVIQSGQVEWPLASGVWWKLSAAGYWSPVENIYPWEIPGSHPGIPFPLTGGPG